jgi:8-oxo-dGTP pyrophosphatase MutT (NUDIX family)
MSKNFFLSTSFLSPWVDTYPAECKQVVTCFLQRGNRILMLQRGRKDAQFQLWGIPGGKQEKDETHLEALCRELKEELGISFSEDQFIYLGSVLSKTSTDGVYGLHLYHAKFPDDYKPEINSAEHLAYQWVTLEEFKHAPLLHAQGEAFLFVEEILTNIINQGLQSCQRS